MIEQPKKYTDEDGNEFWYLPSKGKDHYHRLDGPAVEYENGTKEWWVEDKRHRSDGPAFEGINGTKEWWVDGRHHRLDGPAVEFENGTKCWYVDDKLHRLDGPAIKLSNGSKNWWLNGKRLPTEEVEIWLEENDVDLKTEAGQMAFKLRWS